MRAFVATLCIVAICGGCGGEMATQEKASSSPEEPTSAKSESVVEDTDAGDKKMDEPIVIDVRSQEEWDEGHIEGAIHIPHDVIGEKIAEHVTDKSATIKFY